MYIYRERERERDHKSIEKWSVLVAPPSSESTLAGCPPPVSTDKNNAPKFIGVLMHQGEPIGLGFRVDDWFLTARHVVDRCGGEMSVLTAFGVCSLSKETSEWSTWKSRDLEFTGGDVAAIRPAKSVFAMSGLKCARSKTVRAIVPTSFEVYGVTINGYFRSRGMLRSEETQKVRSRSLTAHTAATEPGFSGSPMVAWYNGSPTIIGMHIAGDVLDRGCNYAASGPALQQFMRDKKIATEPFLEPPVLAPGSESKTGEKGRQHDDLIDYDDWEE